MPIPAGWYPDPAGSFQQRWWTGEAWTNDFAQYRPTLIHSAPTPEVLIKQNEQPQMLSDEALLEQQRVAAAAVAAQLAGQQSASYAPTQTLTRDQPAAAAPTAYRLPDADQPPQTSVAQPNAGNATLIAVTPSYRSAPIGSSLETNYQPFGFASEVRAGGRVNPELRYTLAAWLMAALPLVLVGAAYALATFVPVLYTTVAQAILVVVFLIAAVALAAFDRHALRLDGHERTVSPALALLTPLVFLTVRAVSVARETGRNATGPLVVLLLVAAAITAALLLVDGLLPLLITATALY